MEGGWNPDDATRSPACRASRSEGAFHPDSSVVFSQKEYSFNNIQLTGEVVSKKLDAQEVERWIVANYPTAVNSTCGLHVHMSFPSSLSYSLLMTPNFTTFLCNELRNWGIVSEIPPDHCLWSRLNGESEYCRAVYYGDKQAFHKKKDYNREREGSRYTVVNYTYNMYRTIEVRVLPMMPTPKLSVSAVMEVLRLTNKFLYMEGIGRLKPIHVNIPSTPELGLIVEKEFTTPCVS